MRSIKIEAVQALLSILITNYGDIMLYYFVGDIKHALDIFIQPSWALSYTKYWYATITACICQGISVFFVLLNGTCNATLTAPCKAALILFSINLISSWVWRFAFFYKQSIEAAVPMTLFMSSSTFVTWGLFLAVKRSAALLFIPYIFWVIYVTIYSLSTTEK